MTIKSFRRLTQAFTALLIIAIPILNKNGIMAVTGTLYSMAFGPLLITDPLSGFQVIITSIQWDNVLLLSMLIPILLALALGRVFCGWMCPQNTLSEIFDFINEKLKIKRLFRPKPSAKWRYGLLIILLAMAVLLRFPAANLISAPGIISVQATKYLYEGTVGLELGLILLIITAELFLIRRLWCNYICPVGGFLGIFRFKNTMRVAYREDAAHVCGRCYECVKACQLGLDPMGGKIYPLCHNCGDCIAACEKIKHQAKPLFFTMR
jgi:ferredoxin-type protein NapH